MPPLWQGSSSFALKSSLPPPAPACPRHVYGTAPIHFNSTRLSCCPCSAVSRSFGGRGGRSGDHSLAGIDIDSLDIDAAVVRPSVRPSVVEVVLPPPLFLRREQPVWCRRLARLLLHRDSQQVGQSFPRPPGGAHMSGGRRTDVLVIALISYRAPSPLLSSSPLPDVSVHRSLGWQWRWLQPLPPPLGKRLVEIESKREKEAEGGRDRTK